jgi:hypothetical protein
MEHYKFFEIQSLSWQFYSYDSILQKLDLASINLLYRRFVSFLSFAETGYSNDCDC